MRRLRIAMVAACPFPANRGTPSRIKGMIEALGTRGHDVTVVAYHLGADTDLPGVEIRRTPVIPYGRFEPGPTVTKLALLDPMLTFALWKLLRDKPVDVIHAHHFEGALAAYAVRAVKSAKVIYDAHTTLESELPTYNVPHMPRLSRWLDRKVPHWADHVVAVSHSMGKFLESVGVPATKIDVVPTGVNPSDFARGDGAAIRQRWKLDGRPVVMYTGSLAPFQEVDHLFDAMARVTSRNGDAVLMLVTGAEDEQARARRIRILDPARCIVAVEPGFERIPDYLAAADVVVSPRSVCAGIPQKLANYMAAAKAIVSFEGSAKLLTHGVNGWVVPDRDAAAMADGIERLLADPSLRARLGEQARHTVSGQVDWDTLAGQLERVYLRLVDAPPTSS